MTGVVFFRAIDNVLFVGVPTNPDGLVSSATVLEGLK